MKKFLVAVLLSFAALTVILTGDNMAHASDTEMDIFPAKVEGSAQMSWFQCPCVRWVVQFKAAGGDIQTRDFLISSEALFKFHDEATVDFQNYAVQLFNAGALQALWKGGHVGMGFNGVTWGEDRDRGYSDILRTGFYGIVNLLLSRAARVDLHTAYDYETMRANLGPKIDRGLIDQSVDFGWKTGRWSGNIMGHIGFDTQHMLDPSYFVAGASAAVRARVFNFHNIELGMGAEFSIEHDGLRNYMGMLPDLVTGALTMDVSYVEKTPDTN